MRRSQRVRAHMEVKIVFSTLSRSVSVPRATSPLSRSRPISAVRQKRPVAVPGIELGKPFTTPSRCRGALFPRGCTPLRFGRGARLHLGISSSRVSGKRGTLIRLPCVRTISLERRMCLILPHSSPRRPAPDSHREVIADRFPQLSAASPPLVQEGPQLGASRRHEPSGDSAPRQDAHRCRARRHRSSRIEDEPGARRARARKHAALLPLRNRRRRHLRRV